MVRVTPRQRVTFNVSFSASHENAVKIYKLLEGREPVELISFNNYYGKGAGAEWDQGGGDYSPPEDALSASYIIKGLNKGGPPSGGLSWQKSKFKIFDAESCVGFDDTGRDNDWNDAKVCVIEGACP